MKIDSTKPTKHPDKVSYRYPFIDDENGNHTAPADFNGWDNYQGKQTDALKSVNVLLSAVNDQLKIYKRTPK